MKVLRTWHTYKEKHYGPLAEIRAKLQPEKKKKKKKKTAVVPAKKAITQFTLLEYRRRNKQSVKVPSID